MQEWEEGWEAGAGDQGKRNGEGAGEEGSGQTTRHLMSRAARVGIRLYSPSLSDSKGNRTPTTGGF